jgi:hypothetical protein
MVWPAIIAGAASLGGGLLGNLFGAGDREEANQIMQDQYEQWRKFNPEEYRAAMLASQAGGAQGDRESDDYERMAIQEMAKRAQGRSPQANAAIARGLAEAGSYERGSRDAQLQRLNPNSGAGIAARMMASQQGANRANIAGLQGAAQQDDSMREAIRAMAGMSSNRSGRMFGQNFQRGSASDAMSQFNENNRFRGHGMNTNTKLARLQGMGQAAQGAANAKMGNATNAANMWAGIGEGAGNVINSAWGGGGGAGQGSGQQNYGYEEPESMMATRYRY